MKLYPICLNLAGYGQPSIKKRKNNYLVPTSILKRNSLVLYKDFLLLYNKISESCFVHCVNQLTERDLSQDESRCVDVCTQKFANVNHKVIQIYMEIQPQIVSRRMEEMAQKAEATANLTASADQSVPSPETLKENSAVG